VVELYVAHIGFQGARPLQELKGFRRVMIRAGRNKDCGDPLRRACLPTGRQGICVENDSVGASRGRIVRRDCAAQAD